MKKIIVLNLAFLGVFLLAGCGQKSITQKNSQETTPKVQQSENKNSEPKSNNSYSYCKPDEDPDFKLTNEDDLYYYYTGDKSIRGVVYQQNLNNSITWDTHVDQSCNFELTNNYVSNIDTIKNDFDINDAWKNQPNCDPEDGSSNLEGVYIIHVKGFKVPKSYIQQYDPSRMRDKMYMSRFSFFVDYDRIDKVDERSQVKCPIVVY